VSRLLVVTAVLAERDAIAPALGDGAEVIVGGVGPAESAASTARALATGSYDRVLSAGIGGGFPGVEIGSVVAASAIVFADLGAQDSDQFVPLDDLGFGRTTYRPNLGLDFGLRLGPILTVSTVTGRASSAESLLARFPDALAEAMEGAGVAAAASGAGVAFGEVRAISNAVGPRNRDAWRIPQALAALRSAFEALNGRR
jgi:futalosine hydrolase